MEDRTYELHTRQVLNCISQAGDLGLYIHWHPPLIATCGIKLSVSWFRSQIPVTQLINLSLRARGHKMAVGYPGIPDLFMFSFSHIVSRHDPPPSPPT